MGNFSWSSVNREEGFIFRGVFLLGKAILIEGVPVKSAFLPPPPPLLLPSLDHRYAPPKVSMSISTYVSSLPHCASASSRASLVSWLRFAPTVLMNQEGRVMRTPEGIP